ncbi:DUF1624 domain-containing protein [Ramlibacter sp.]|uniref:DUF1624 domain-containing protein n=1 Tax=Ramlibacter sp. TaxID=1917967 RepID=UPI003D0D7505
MTAYHFCWDLANVGWIRQNFYGDPFWTTQRTLIVSLFLFCAGLGQAVAVEQKQSWRRFWERWGQVAGCAVLVSIGSWFMFRERFIYFGVLHGIAVMLIVVRLTSGWGRWLWPAGALAIAANWIVLPGFDTRALNWIGFASTKPPTEDYVPLVPWLGVMWWGMASGRWLLQNKRPLLAKRPSKTLALLGRWSLTWYMAHQPVLIGVLMLLK